MQPARYAVHSPGKSGSGETRAALSLSVGAIPVYQNGLQAKIFALAWTWQVHFVLFSHASVRKIAAAANHLAPRIAQSSLAGRFPPGIRRKTRSATLFNSKPTVEVSSLDDRQFNPPVLRNSFFHGNFPRAAAIGSPF